MNLSSFNSEDQCFKKTSASKRANGDTPLWTHSMCREMQEIIPGLYLGPKHAASRSRLDTLMKTGITHIVCVRQESEAAFIKPNFPEKFKYIIIDISNPEISSMIPLFPQTKYFIDSCLKSGGKVLVHGNTGDVKSATLVIGYVMETKCMSYMDAVSFVQKRRQCVGLSEPFLQQLKEYEPIYKAWRNHLSGHSSRVPVRHKRRCDELEDNVAFNSKMEICEEASA